MERRELSRVVLLLVAVTAIGTFGYSVIEGWNFIDSLYMTVITLTTTGFSEVKPLSELGRVFTIFLLIGGVGIVAYAATAVFGSIVASNFQLRGRRSMISRIKRFHNHTVVIGFGRMGQVICRELKEAGRTFVVIEKNEKHFDELQKNDYVWIRGDATDDEILAQAGIERAKYFVSMVDSDADSLYLALAAKSLNPNIYSIVRANESSARKKILLAGADRVILPYMMTGFKVAQSIINPAVEDFLELSNTPGSDNTLQLIDVAIQETSELANRALRDSGIRQKGLMVIGVRQSDNSFIFAPGPDHMIRSTDRLVVLGSREDCNKAMKELGMVSP